MKEQAILGEWYQIITSCQVNSISKWSAFIISWTFYYYILTRLSGFWKIFKYWVTLLTLTTESYWYIKERLDQMIFPGFFHPELCYDFISLPVTSKVTDSFPKSLLPNELPGLHTNPSWLQRSVTLCNPKYHLAPSNTNTNRDLRLICPSCLQNRSKEQYFLKKPTTISI